MKTNKNFNKYLLGSILAVSTMGLFSCSSDDTVDNEETPDVNDPTALVKRDLTVTQETTAEAKPTTRTTLTLDGSTLNATWTGQEDKLLFYNITKPQYKTDEGETHLKVQENLTAESTAQHSYFSGSVTCAQDNKMALFFPTINGTTVVDNYTITETDEDGTISYTYGTTNNLELNLSEQDGTLDFIGKYCDFTYGSATITKVNGNTATASLGNMTNLCAIVKFTLADEITDGTLKSVAISGVRAEGTIDLTTGTITDNGTVGSVVIKNANGLNNTFYVALLPGEMTPSFKYNVVDSEGNETAYIKTFGTATLQAGKYYGIKVSGAEKEATGDLMFSECYGDMSNLCIEFYNASDEDINLATSTSTYTLALRETPTGDDILTYDLKNTGSTITKADGGVWTDGSTVTSTLTLISGYVQKFSTREVRGQYINYDQKSSSFMVQAHSSDYKYLVLKKDGEVIDVCKKPTYPTAHTYKRVDTAIVPTATYDENEWVEQAGGKNNLGQRPFYASNAL